MKKTYIAPQATVVKMAPTTSILTFSAQMDTGQSITTSDDFGARENNDWDIWD